MVTEDSSREVWLRQARSYLRNADPVLARLIDDRPDFDFAEARLDNPFGLVLPMDLFGALLFQITGQQLSVPATRGTLARTQALFSGHLPSACWRPPRSRPRPCFRADKPPGFPGLTPSGEDQRPSEKDVSGPRARCAARWQEWRTIPFLPPVPRSHTSRD